MALTGANAQAVERPGRLHDTVLFEHEHEGVKACQKDDALKMGVHLCKEKFQYHHSAVVAVDFQKDGFKHWINMDSHEGEGPTGIFSQSFDRRNKCKFWAAYACKLTWLPTRHQVFAGNWRGTVHTDEGNFRQLIFNVDLRSNGTYRMEIRTKPGFLKGENSSIKEVPPSFQKVTLANGIEIEGLIDTAHAGDDWETVNGDWYASDEPNSDGMWTATIPFRTSINGSSNHRFHLEWRERSDMCTSVKGKWDLGGPKYTVIFDLK